MHSISTLACSDVDGSFILQLPTDEAFEGGGLTIWDGPGRDIGNPLLQEGRTLATFPHTTCGWNLDSESKLPKMREL